MNWIRRAMDRVKRQFPFLSWELKDYAKEVDRVEPSEGLTKHLETARYSLRLQRYWWAARAIEQETRRLGRPIVVVDLGCERGWMKRFTSPTASIRWIGVDGNVDHPSLVASKYDETHVANFDVAVPLPDETADVVVSLHVFEHLNHPETTASEVCRILRPDGLFLLGTPVTPPIVSAIRTGMLHVRNRMGMNRHWGHLRKFSPASLGALCKQAGLSVQFLVGSHLFRRRGSSLENIPAWIRLNQFWGNLFPSLGTEACMAARKTRPAPSMVQSFWLRFDWAVPVLAAVAIGYVVFRPATSMVHPLMDEVAHHQDGNDVFRWCNRSGLDRLGNDNGIVEVGDPSVLRTLFSEYRAKGKDLHIVVSAEHLDAYDRTNDVGILHVTDEWQHNGQRFLVLSQEEEFPTIELWRERSDL